MQITKMSKCIGCAVCENICPVEAIQMMPLHNDLGFWYPVIDEAKCISCKKCISLCTANCFIEKNKPLRYEIAQTCDINDLKTTTSGGVSSLLAKQFIEERNGIVYGAAFNTDMEVIHIRCETIADCDKLKGSKYVQSKTADTYDLIKSDLEKDVPVLFIGTPCQCASMLKFREYSEFFMCDIVCNGVGSPEVFKAHIRQIEKKHKAKVLNYIFRPKTKKYLEPYELVKLDTGKILNLNSPWEKWGTIYYNGLIMREACYSCNFTTVDRVGDLTFSDIPEEYMSDTNLKEDVSRYGATYISVNTLKGENLMMLVHEKSSYTSVQAYQKNRMKEAIKKPASRDLFVSCYQNSDLEEAKSKVFGKRTKIKSGLIKCINNLKKQEK